MIQRIIDECCAEFGVSRLDLRSELRRPPLVLCREAIVLIARRHTRMSFPELAFATGRPTHTSTLAQHERAVTRVVSNAEFDAQVKRVEARLGLAERMEYRPDGSLRRPEGSQRAYSGS